MLDPTFQQCLTDLALEAFGATDIILGSWVVRVQSSVWDSVKRQTADEVIVPALHSVTVGFDVKNCSGDTRSVGG